MQYRPKWATSLRGKTVAVTGTTGGLGRELCRCLAKAGADLILLDRNAVRSDAWRAELNREYPTIAVRCLPLELENMEQVRETTEQLKQLKPHVFVHNAGAYSIPRRTCDTGLDNVFQINFAAPYHMICALLPTLSEVGGHVVAVGSIAHTYARIDEKDVDFASRRQAAKAYGNSKRFLMFALYEKFKTVQGVTLSVAHPGITLTNITAHYPKWIFALIRHPMKILFMHPRKACLSILRGVYEPCGYHEWLGPRVLDIWGMPRKRVLRTVSEAESRRIGEIAEEIVTKMDT